MNAEEQIKINKYIFSKSQDLFALVRKALGKLRGIEEYLGLGNVKLADTQDRYKFTQNKPGFSFLQEEFLIKCSSKFNKRKYPDGRDGWNYYVGTWFGYTSYFDRDSLECTYPLCITLANNEGYVSTSISGGFSTANFCRIVEGESGIEWSFGPRRDTVSSVELVEGTTWERATPDLISFEKNTAIIEDMAKKIIERYNKDFLSLT